MASRKEVKERRNRVRQALSEGVPINVIAKLEGVLEKTIYLDKKAILSDDAKKLSKNESLNLIADFNMKQDQAYRDARALFRESNHENIKLGALNTASKLQSDKIKVYMDAGIVDKAVDKFEVEASADVGVSFDNVMMDAYKKIKKREAEENESEGNDGGE